MGYKELIKQMSLLEKCAILSGDTVFTTRAYPRRNIPAINLSGRLLRRRSGACPIPLPGIFSFGARAARFLRRWHRRALLCLQIAMQY